MTSVARQILSLAVLGLAGLAAPAAAAPDPVGAAAVFADAKAICDRDRGAFWGQTLCGPILLVDPTDSAILANQPDANGVLKPSGAYFVGVLPPSEIMANTPVDWAGTHWTQLLWPFTNEPGRRQVTLAHELFHRIQPALGLIRPEGANAQLDILEGRYLLQLEWRALAKALQAPTPAARRAAVSDALAFRHERQRLFPDAAVDEGALEIDEGVPEYTGVRLGLAAPKDQIAYALRDLSAFVTAPTFVRSFAYATGPALGLLLDRADPAWRGKLASGQRLDQLLARAYCVPDSVPTDLKAREAAYDDGTLRATERLREDRRLARLAGLRAALVDGPVLVIPLHKSSYQFNPQTLVGLDGVGAVYPTLRLSAEFGTLVVTGGDGALLDKGMTVARVSAVGADPTALAGPGWTLTLKPGWTLRAGPRPGDLTATPPAP